MKTTKTEQLKKFYYISDWAKDLLKTIPEDIELDTTRKFKTMTLEELGFENGAMTKEILNEEFLKTKGLALCNPKDVFLIEPKDWCYVAMNPITDRDGDPGVFSLRSDDAELELYGRSADSDFGWDSGVRFVFLVSTSTSETQNLPSDTLNLELARAIGVCVIHGYSVIKNK
jgi:hypothetical protein